MPHCMNFSVVYLYILNIKETLFSSNEQHLCTHLAHSWSTVCSGRTVPGDTGVVRGEALRDALVPVPWWTSTCDGSRVLSLSPLVCGMGDAQSSAQEACCLDIGLNIKETLFSSNEQHLCTHLAHSWSTVCSGRTVPGDTGVVRGEALRDALVPVPWWTSTCDGSRVLSLSPLVCGMGDAQSSAQEACCLDIGFRHMSSAPDCVAFSCCMRRVAEEREPLHSFE